NIPGIGLEAAKVLLVEVIRWIEGNGSLVGFSSCLVIIQPEVDITKGRVGYGGVTRCRLEVGIHPFLELASRLEVGPRAVIPQVLEQFGGGFLARACLERSRLGKPLGDVAL